MVTWIISNNLLGKTNLDCQSAIVNGHVPIGKVITNWDDAINVNFIGKPNLFWFRWFLFYNQLTRRIKCDCLLAVANWHVPIGKVITNWKNAITVFYTGKPCFCWKYARKTFDISINSNYFLLNNQLTGKIKFDCQLAAANWHVPIGKVITIS